MKFRQKHEVWRDRLTGTHYIKETYLQPVAVVDSFGTSTIKGVILTPYGGYQEEAWGEKLLNGEGTAREQFGYNPVDFGQQILVTEEMLAERFDYKGVMSQEIDMEEAVAKYESECCDFSNREDVLNSAIRQLRRMVPAKWACELYTLIKDFQANTPKKSKN